MKAFQTDFSRNILNHSIIKQMAGKYPSYPVGRSIHYSATRGMAPAARTEYRVAIQLAILDRLNHGLNHRPTGFYTGNAPK